MYLKIKRFFDIVVSLIALIVLCPLVIIISVLIKLDSNGPVIYKSIRVGKFQQRFTLYKFRTMVENAELLGASSTSDDDSRLTRIGKLLRRYKLDEIPQLINILKGEMSFVGPRPQVPWIVELDQEKYNDVLTVKPGLAAYAFVILPGVGEVLTGSSDLDADYLKIYHPKKISLSLLYVKNQSFLLDMKIFIDTALLSFFKTSLFFRDKRVKNTEYIGTK